MDIQVPRLDEVSVRRSETRARHRAQRPRILVAVRHTRNLCGDRADDLAKSLTILLVANLAARPPIDVTPRIAGARIARRHIDYIVESIVLQVGDQLHVIVQLLDAVTDVPVLTRTVTGTMRTIRHVAAAVAWTVANDIEGAFDRSVVLPAQACAT